MSESYIDKFNILKTFKTDEHQNILIGSVKDKTNEMVLINIFHNKKHILGNSKSNLEVLLKNLVHLEQKSEEVIVVTKFDNGIPLNKYFDQAIPNINHRMNMVFEYLKHIVRYDGLETNLKKNLVDEMQIVIKNKEMFFNEMIIMDKDFTEMTEFKAVATNIGITIKKILFENMDNNIPNDFLNKITKFINELEDNKSNYKNINEIYDSFRRIYLYEWTMRNVPLKKNFNEQLKEGKTDTKKRFSVLPLLVIIGIIGIGLFSYKYMDTKPKESIENRDMEQPKVTIKENRIEEKEELPKPNIDSKEKLENIAITYEDVDHIVKDYDRFKSGKYSMKFINNEDHKLNSIEIKNLNLEKNSIISMWITSDSKDDVKVEIVGLLEEKNVFKKVMNYIPSQENVWQLMNVNGNGNKMDEVKIKVFNNNGVVWVDDIELDSYK
ncbi:hypothetical protein IZY60_11350 [Lutibacter sp. B2]|nr:hypothetical protein [Lutibacter sp. B2]